MTYSVDNIFVINRLAHFKSRKVFSIFCAKKGDRPSELINAEVIKGSFLNVTNHAFQIAAPTTSKKPIYDIFNRLATI